MDGNTRQTDTLLFLQGLLSEPITADQPITLRSVQRAAFSSWLRKQSIALDMGAIVAGNFTLNQLFGSGQAVAPPSGSRPASDVVASSGLAIAIGGVGIDIEDVASMPEADDFREHPFYRDNFTTAELAHCIRQSDVRASLCGIWAAKEAVIKAGLSPLPNANVGHIEISYDQQGQPLISGGQLSISHTSNAAVAICIASGGQSQAAPPSPVAAVREMPIAEVSIEETPRSPKSGRAVLALLLLIIVGLIGALIWALNK